jgi:pantoate--beta-alanine ligase
MNVIKSSKEIESAKFSNPFAFIPTMGNLHQGHLSLVEYAIENYSEVLVSIFINPLQFGKNEDFSSYPKTITKDIRLLKNLGCDYLFLPEENFAEDLKAIEPKFADVLCGVSRPIHFQGVLTIVDKYLRLIKPNACLFGLKDYQQQLIIKDYVKRKKIKTDIISLPTVREQSGLAMSSRNNYLSEKDKKHCGKVFSCLTDIAKSSLTSSLDSLKKSAIDYLTKAGFKLDYLEFVDANDLSKVTKKTEKLLIAVAVKYKKVRLIDNIIVPLN